MDYNWLRSINLGEKGSCIDVMTPTVDFGRFTVAFTTKGEAFIVDREIADVIKLYKWSVDNVGYLQARIKGTRVRLHELVMALKCDDKPDGCVVDHVNLDKLDNRVINLRFVRQWENSANIRNRRDSSSGITGVSKNKRGYYEAYITVNKRLIHLGHFDTLEAARQARLEAEEKYGFINRPKTVSELLERKDQEVEREGFGNIPKKVSADVSD